MLRAAATSPALIPSNVLWPLVRRQLRVSVSFVSEIVDGREVVRHSAGDGSLPAFVAGAAVAAR